MARNAPDSPDTERMMMAETMVERVARAICKVNGTSPDAYNQNGFNGKQWKLYVEGAKAAIEAMRDGLTEDMAAAMECQFSTEAQWTAAIDAALAPTVQDEERG